MKTLIKPGDVISVKQSKNMVVTWADSTEVRAESCERVNDAVLTKKLVGPADSVEGSIDYLWREDEFGVMRVGSNDYFEWYLLKEDKQGKEKTLAKAIQMAYNGLGVLDKGDGDGQTT